MKLDFDDESDHEPTVVRGEIGVPRPEHLDARAVSRRAGAGLPRDPEASVPRNWDEVWVTRRQERGTGSSSWPTEGDGPRGPSLL